MSFSITGCPVGMYGVKCQLNCSVNCISKACDLDSGHCILGCIDGWVSERCNESKLKLMLRII